MIRRSRFEFPLRLLPWLNLPLALLLTLLQRTPALRLLTATGDHVLASRASELLRATLTDPKLEILNGSAVKVAENDNWSVTLGPTAASVGAFPLIANSQDAAVLVTLPPGAYSAQISGMGRGTGEALVEVYEVP
jgi:hypothetical protein